MTYAQPSAARQRPAVVTAAGVLLFVAAAAALGQAIVQFLQISPVAREFEPLYARFGDADAGRTVASGMFGVTGGGAIAFALAYAVLGAFDLAGKNGARITTWVFAGLGTLCCGCTSALFSTLGFGDLASRVQEQASDRPGGPSQQEVVEAFDRAIPSWYTMALLSLTAVLVLSLIIAMILLSLPASSEFFRKKPLTWVPPTATAAPGGWSGYGAPPSDTPIVTPTPIGQTYIPPADPPSTPTTPDTPATPDKPKAGDAVDPTPATPAPDASPAPDPTPSSSDSGSSSSSDSGSSSSSSDSGSSSS